MVAKADEDTWMKPGKTLEVCCNLHWFRAWEV
jgi:hypothetical protein